MERGGRAGTLVSLPRGVPHTLRVPAWTALYLLLTDGAPSLDSRGRWARSR